jgi:hypothetical protein
MTIAPYPLQWPEGFPRRSGSRESGQFRTSLSAALSNVRDSMHRFGQDSGKPVADLVITSNVTLGGMTGTDPGIAVWFTWDSEQRCIAVDRYAKPEANLQAIHHVLEARRTELRHGTLALVRATMKGFALSLPAPGSKPWWDVLGVSQTAPMVDIETAYRRLAAERHPDKGGSDAMMAELNRARDLARKERE